MNSAHESIFIASIRSFCKSVATLFGIGFGLIAIVFLIKIVGGSNYINSKSELTLVPNADGERDLLGYQAPVVLRIDIHGTIGMNDLTRERVENLLLDSREGLLKGNRVKAILLHIDSPGGYVRDSETIYRALLDYKKKFNTPIYAYVDGTCASGALFIACAADKIYASTSSVIGSVGVYSGPYFNFSEWMQKTGIQSQTITAGKDKDALNPFRPWKPDEATPEQRVTEAQYDRFVSIVSQARPLLTKERLTQEYGAHIYIDQEAQELGYIDQAGTSYAQALADLATFAQIQEKYQVVKLSPQHMLLNGLTNSLLFKKVFQNVTEIYNNFNQEGHSFYLYRPN